MKEGMNHINTQSVVPQQCPSLLSTKQRTKAGCCLAWAPPRWLTGTVKSSEASERSAYAAFMTCFSSLHFSVSMEPVAVFLWMPAYIPEGEWGRTWTEANVYVRRFLDGFYILEIKNGFLEIKHTVWKWRQKHYKVMKIWNHILIAGDDFKRSFRKQAMWNCVFCSNGK